MPAASLNFHFFNGKPCKHNQVALRTVKGGCTECMLLRSKDAYAKLKNSPNWELIKEKIRMNRKKLFKENKERVLRKNWGNNLILLPLTY